MSDSLEIAVETLKQGDVICHACEGVWGFACDPFNEKAVAKILRIKGREASKGLIVIGHEWQAFEPELAQVPPPTVESIRASWPGHITWLVPNVRFSKWITGQFDTVAVRVPDHAQSRNIARLYGGPLVSTSVNLTGEPAITTNREVTAKFGSKVAHVVPGETGGALGPSKIFHSLTGERIR